MATIIFLLAIGIAGYAFIGYPLLAIMRARIDPIPDAPLLDAAGLPRLTVLLAARDEAARLPARLANLLECDYPHGLVDILVVDDGSTDPTATVVEGFDPRVRLLRVPGQRGKAAAINAGMRQATSPIVVFADARQSFSRNTLLALAQPFANPAVGAVTGELVMCDAGSGQSHPAGLYWKLEKRLREAEARLGWAHAASGAIYALRSHLFEPIPDGLLLDDLHTPLWVVRKGYLICHAPEAKAFDPFCPPPVREFARKLRTLAGNWQLVARAPWVLSPAKNPALFAFASHKLSRLIAPWALLVAFIASLSSPALLPFFWIQASCYLVALLALAFPGGASRLPGASAAASFLLLNAAAALSLPAWAGLNPSRLWRT